MSVLGEHGTRLGAINLAHVAPFRLGALDVLSPTRQLVRGARRETLEPRVMQVLVALWQAGGAVVSRDDLIARSWEGRIVGDNAIQRTISRLRDIADGIGQGCFELETINKVGYRLIALESSPQQPEEHSPAQSKQPRPAGRSGRNFVWVGSAFGAVAIIVGLAVWARSPAADPITIAVVAHEANANALASGLAIDLSRLANARGAVAFTEAVGDVRPGFLLTVTERRLGNNAQTDLAIEASGSHELVWSASFSGTENDRSLRQRAAYAVSKVTECAFLDNNNSPRSDDSGLQQVFSGCDRLNDSLDSGPDDATVAIWRNIVTRDPGNARALATLAFAEAFQSADNSTAEKPEAMRGAAHEHLQKARALDDRLGLTYAAEAILLPAWQYREKLAILDRGLALDSNCAALHSLKSYVLMSVGFVGDAIASARRAVDVSPAYPSYRANLAMTLAYAGLNGGATTELAAAERIWPDSPAVKDARFRYDYRFGDAARLIREIDAGRPLPNGTPVFDAGIARAFLLARSQPTAENIDRLESLAMRYGHSPHTALQALVTFGRIDQAYALMRDRRRVAEMRSVGTYILFRANMRPFVLDRRFMPLAGRLGLVQFWRSANWPSFCDDKDIPYSCEAEARRVHPAKAT